MNIGQIKQNDAGIFMGRISTLAVAMTIAPVRSMCAASVCARWAVSGVGTGARMSGCNNTTSGSMSVSNVAVRRSAVMPSIAISRPSRRACAT